MRARKLHPFGVARLPIFVAAAILLLSPGCDDGTTPAAIGAMTQRGYLWQRDWTPAVSDAFNEGQRRFDAVVLLGGEVMWDGTQPRLIRSSIAWDRVGRSGKRCGIALRVAPFGGPFDDRTAQFLADTAEALVADATSHGAALSEFQLDFDCAQKKLSSYRVWVTRLRAALAPLPLVITALPAWLEEPELRALLSETNGFVLQVHSVPIGSAATPGTLCDPTLARRWAAQAAKFGRTFTIALPTYRCLAGYGDGGKLLGVAMDAVQPSWPAGTRVLEFRSDPDELARLVHEWNARRPANMDGVIWYRIPTGSDVRNWPWRTLVAVSAGREPSRRLEIRSTGENPIDLLLANNGEAEEQISAAVVVKWRDAMLTASDALPGWTLQTTETQAVFTPEANRLRLLPEEQRGIGWLRFDRAPPLETQIRETVAGIP